jgi:aldose 1-epimerase
MKLSLCCAPFFVYAPDGAAQDSPAPAAAGTAAALIRLEEREFGKLDDGTVVRQFTLRNAKGMMARIIIYGAIISELQAPDRNGAMTNVARRRSRWTATPGESAFPVRSLGRVANRIAGARFD